MQNWNDGKAQEFKDRKVYDISHSQLHKKEIAAHADPLAPVREPAQKAAKGTSGVLLFKTPTCPNCKAAEALLNKAGIAYTPLNANEQKELTQEYGVRQAPTLVLLNGDRIEKFRGVSDIKGWLMNR